MTTSFLSFNDRNPDQTSQTKIYQRLIEPLEKEDQKHESSLLETINTYFQSNKNISLTATNMYVHRNTIIYRLKNRRDSSLNFRISLIVRYN